MRRLFGSTAAAAVAMMLCGGMLCGRERMPLPAVPGELRDPAARAEYVARHYWDAVDWSDPSQAVDTLWLEGSFADYALILAMPGASVRAGAVHDMLERAAGYGGDGVMCHLARLYLYDTASPVWNEEVYLPFAEWWMSRHADDERVAEEWRAASVGREGEVAPDMTIMTREGKSLALSELWRDAGPEGMMRVVFYAPGCGDCHELLGRLARERSAEHIVLVYVGDDIDSWSRDAERWPALWTVGQVSEEDSPYELRRTPVRYILDGEGRVLKRLYGL